MRTASTPLRPPTPLTRFVHASRPSSPASSSPYQHLLDIDLPCPLLDTPPAILSLLLDCLDDTSAIHCLSSCTSLHAGYHSYPLKQAMSSKLLQQLSHIDVYYRYRKHGICFMLLWTTLFLLAAVYLHTQSVLLANFVVPPLLYVMGCGLPFVVRSLTRAHRADCCSRGRRVDSLTGWYHMPRVTKLRDVLCDWRLRRYLQHVTDMATIHLESAPFSKYPLPRSLRSLQVFPSPDLILEPDTLPPQLTSLSLWQISSTPLHAGVLPQSLISLHLVHGFDPESICGAGVLPSSLRVLEVEQWPPPLSQLALPASLTELNVRLLSDHPLPVLPLQLQVLRIGGAFNQPLTGVLPASLRVLRLVGEFNQPLTADVLASIPQLEELHLSDYPTFRQLPISVLPRSMRVLRVGERYTLFMSDASPQPAAATAATAAASLLNASLSSVPAATDTAITTTPFSSACTFTSCRLWIDGVVMSVWAGDETSSSSSRQLVWWEPPQGEHRLGTLCWCTPGERQRVAGQQLAVHDIRELRLHRESPALRSPQAVQRVDTMQCLALTSAGRAATFCAECNSVQEREQWVKEMYRMLVPMTWRLPPPLHRLIVPAEWDAERVEALQQLGQAGGYTVERRPA